MNYHRFPRSLRLQNPLWYGLPMFLVGITGGLASGKSTIAMMFQSLGAEVIDADELARKVVKPRKVAWKEIVKVFGRKVLNQDRSLNRETLASIVFNHPQKLKILNAIIHPRVAREQARITRDIALRDPSAIIIYDAALLIEAGAHKRMNRVIVVTADQKTQIIRACKRGGLTKKQALHRIRHQLPFRCKKLYADYVINGTLPLGQLRPIVKDLYSTFQHQEKGSHSRFRGIKSSGKQLAKMVSPGH